MRAIRLGTSFAGSRARWLRAFAATLALIVATALTAGAETAATQYSQDELDQLLAPIALYPDQLLTQVLIASTYPLEVVHAARFVQQNPSLSGAALDDAVAARNWDPSVQSLTAFPQVLSMMYEKLEWTERLGDAFLVDQGRVLDTVQALRGRARATGNLASSAQQSVTQEDGQIVIAPVQPDVVYIPVYDPLIVYGPWWAPAYPPWFWYPPYFYGYPAVFVGMTIVFGHGVHVGHDHWGWCNPDWHGHHIALDVRQNRFWEPTRLPGPPPPGMQWRHAPDHRRGVAYPDAQTRARYLGEDAAGVRARQSFRGYEGGARPQLRPPTTVAPPGPQVQRPAAGEVRVAPAPQPSLQRETRPTERAPAFDPGISRREVEINAQRGLQSRQTLPQPMAPAAPARAPAPHVGAGEVRRTR